MKYKVFIDQTVQFYAEVEADSPEQAEERALGNEPFPVAVRWIEYDRLKAEIREDLTEEI